MGRLIELKLKILAKMILRKYRPKIVGISGSIGKTGTKEAAYAVLKGRFRTRRSIKNYNNELGLPLTVIGAASQGRNIFGWILVFLKAAKLLLATDRDYPELLILEMGIDRPGDMDYLLEIAAPDIGVLTYIGSVHMEYFKSRQDLAAEKIKLLRSLSRDAWAVFNFDNEAVRTGGKGLAARLISYGMGSGADLRASNVENSHEYSAGRVPAGISFTLSYQGESAPAVLGEALGEAAVYSALGAAAIALALGLGLKEIASALGGYSPPPGRMRLISGIKQTTIIDDSYNAEPESTRAALRALSGLPRPESARKFAVLGDMLELGGESAELHRGIGRDVFASGADRLITVGERARGIAHGAIEAGLAEDDVFSFSFPAEAGLFIQERLKAGDLVLVKGSQGIRMEKVVKELMAEPLLAGDLLARQDPEWLAKP